MTVSVFTHSTPDNQSSKLPSQDEALVATRGDGDLRWLVWLQKLLGAKALVLYASQTDGANTAMVVQCKFPDDVIACSELEALCVSACTNRSVVQRAEKDNSSRSTVCIPDVAGTAKGDPARYVLAIERDAQTQLDTKTQIRLVCWAFESLPCFTIAGNVTGADSDSANDQTIANQLMLDGVPANSFAQCATWLAALSGSEQCVIATLKTNGRMAGAAHLQGVSGQPRVDNRLSAAQSMVRVIDDAFRNRALSPQCVMDNDVRDASTQARSSQNSSVLTGQSCARLMMSLMIADQWFVVSMTRESRRAFSVAEQARLEPVIRVGLNTVLLADPYTLGLRAAAARNARKLAQRVAERTSVYVASALALALLLVLILYPVEYRISAPLIVEAAEQHVLIAPVDGFVQSVSVSAGDTVSSGQTLATLDDQELQLQLQKLHSEALQNRQSYTRALAAHDRVEMTRLKEEGLSLKSELSRLELQAQKMVVSAPVDGVVLSGSWDDFLGAAVSAGDTLFTLGSDSSHRLVLDVSEYDVSHVRPEQVVAIRLAADPSTVLPAHVRAVMPLAVATAGRNSVQVHARLDTDVQLRPGMQGIGKVLVSRKSRLWQWMDRASARVIWLGWKLGLLR